MTAQIVCGKHQVGIDGAIVIVQFAGHVNYDEWQIMRATFDEIVARQGRVYMIAHVSQASTIDPAVRSEFAAWAKKNPLYGIANVQPNLAARALGLLITNGLRLVGAIHFSSAFVDDEDAGRRFIAEIDRKRFPR